MKEKKKMKVMAGLISILAVAFVLPALILAGDLEPAGPPGPTMHTLDEIYTKLEAVESSLGSSGSEGAPVAKTGQTTSYATGDDGDLQKGVAWPAPRFTDNFDGTVADNLTGLIWLKNANAAGMVKTWADAQTYCNSLASDGTNLTDGSSAGEWRLPNVREIFSLIDFSQYNPALPTAGYPFTNVQSRYYWSSTTYEGDSTSAWHVHMNDGNVCGASKGSSSSVWPVRAGN
jgi:Protein of unknown function (DUF1566)